MQSSLYLHNTSSLHDAAAHSKQLTRQIIIGSLLGLFPLLVMVAFLFMTVVTSGAVYNFLLTRATYGFLYTSPVALLIAVPFLFLKGRRRIAIALPVWAFLTVPTAFVLATML